jgi:hypothetical protein
MPSHQIVFSNRLAPGVSRPLGAHAETLVRVGEQARVYHRPTAVLFRSMEESVRPVFEDHHTQNLGILIKVTVQFRSYLQSASPWPNGPAPLQTSEFGQVLIESGNRRSQFK